MKSEVGEEEEGRGWRGVKGSGGGGGEVKRESEGGGGRCGMRVGEDSG